MRKTSSMILAAILVLVLLPGPLRACFDTYLFLGKHSLVYPKGEIVAEVSGEYTMPRISEESEDLFSGASNIYIGASDRFSMQIGLSSTEKVRSSFSLDSYGIRGVVGLVRNYKDVYNLDFVLEHAAHFDGEESAIEFSAPSIFHFDNTTFVFHPVTSFGKSSDFALRGHGGVFCRYGENALVGIGAEYESAQNGSQFGRRLVRGAGAASIFFGARIGSAYIQNELIKGWGAESNDLGFALTVKYILQPSSNR